MKQVRFCFKHQIVDIAIKWNEFSWKSSSRKEATISLVPSLSKSLCWLLLPKCYRANWSPDHHKLMSSMVAWGGMIWVATQNKALVAASTVVLKKRLKLFSSYFIEPRSASPPISFKGTVHKDQGHEEVDSLLTWASRKWNIAVRVSGDWEEEVVDELHPEFSTPSIPSQSIADAIHFTLPRGWACSGVATSLVFSRI